VLLTLYSPELRDFVDFILLRDVAQFASEALSSFEGR